MSYKFNYKFFFFNILDIYTLVKNFIKILFNLKYRLMSIKGQKLFLIKNFKIIILIKKLSLYIIFL